MTRLSIRHETRYLYPFPVAFGPWRLIMRPSDSHALRLVEARLELTPPGATQWAYDAYGNSVCVFQPQSESNVLSVVNHLVLDRFPNPLPTPPRDDPASTLPILYDAMDRAVLQPFMTPATNDQDIGWEDWLRSFMQSGDTLAMDLLKRINSAIHAQFSYGERYDEGVQSPATTIRLGTGTCRDFAWLMIESVRRLGFAARFVTGYLYAPNANNLGGGATHAWCEIFLPRLGWLEFDPTNGLTESQDLIRVASTRTPEEALPMTGAIFGSATATMEVRVDVRQVPATGLVF
jgi:transglutaminase-like putative cysteine protease